jgi:multidrug resistance protein, MATE family
LQDFAQGLSELRSRDVLAIAIPMIVSNATVPLVGIADMAVIGQLNDPALLGGVSLGATIFAMLFWAFGFLRMGTTALTAQAAGAGDKAAIVANLYRPLLMAAVAGVALFTFHAPATVLTLQLIGGSPAVQTAAAAYFGARIMSAPATLANYALTGWFIGLGRANLALALQLFLNAINIALAIGLVLFAQMGVKGAALAAVFADYAALAAGILIAGPMLRRNGETRAHLFEGQALKRHLAVNGDIMIRTVCLMFAFTFFAAQGARLGDIALAANSVLRALTDLSAYVLDGFAFAAEVLAGQAIGAKNLMGFRRAVALSSAWAAALSIIVSAAFWAGGLLLIQFMTDAPSVRVAAQLLLPWAVLTPIAGVACFQLDGIFIGAAWTADMRNMMAVSLAIFLGAYALLTPAFGNHGLWASLMVFYAARAVTLALRYPALEKASFRKGDLA